MARMRWPSRLMFVFAGIASAAGLGNLWRFPYLTYKYGGGAFLLPYIIAIVVLGIPLLIMEYSLGEMMQGSAPKAFAKISKKLGYVGWLAVLISLAIVSYYVVVIGWGVMYFFKSFTLAWGSNPGAYFTQFLGDTGAVSVLGGLNWVLVLGLLIAWLIIFFRLWNGMKSLSGSLKYFIPIPLILLVLMLIKGITLDGSATGILYFLKPNFSALFDGQVWIAAFSQMLFTLSLAGGSMITFASYEARKGDIDENATIISIADFVVSLLAGLVVFSTIGFMAYQTGMPLDSAVRSGPGIAFIVFPQALNLMPLSTIFAVIFFIIFIGLGTNAATSIMEAAISAVNDARPKWNRKPIVIGLCLLFFLLGLAYTTGAGYYLIDIVDHYVADFGLVLVIILETLVVGWVLGIEKMRYFINKVSDFRIGTWFDWSIMYLAPIFFMFLLVLQAYREFLTPYGDYPLWARLIGIGTVIISIVLALILNRWMREKR